MAGPTERDCAFCKIIRRELPAKIIHEDDDVIAFHDIRPQAPVHYLVVPKAHWPTLLDIPGDEAGTILAKIYDVIKVTVAKLGVSTTGFRVVVNCGRGAGQTIDHLHVHIVGGRFMRWPPG